MSAPYRLRNFAVAGLMSLLAMTVSCSRKTLRTASESDSTASATFADSASMTRIDLRTLSELLTTAISTRAEIRDSLHTRIHTVTTLDADGNVIGQTRTEDTDRVTTRTEDTDSSAASRVERADSASSTASSARRSASASNDSRRTSTSVSTEPWWTSALRWAATLPILAAILACGAAVIRRLRSKR